MDLFGNSLHAIIIKKFKSLLCSLSLSGFTNITQKLHTNKELVKNLYNKDSSNVIKSNFLLPLIYDIKKTFATALGFEILCITSVEIGGSLGLYVWGINSIGIIFSYVLGYCFAWVSTFVTILGRNNFNSDVGTEPVHCCVLLDDQCDKGFIFNFVATFSNFKKGIIHLARIKSTTQFFCIIKLSLIILITAESTCIITTETINLLFLQFSLFVTVPLSFITGTFALTITNSYRKMINKQSHN